MQWIEVTIDTPEDEIDERCDKLTQLGCEGFVIENEHDFSSFIQNNRQYWGVVDEELQKKYQGLSRIKLYLADDSDGRAILKNIKKLVSDNIEESIVKDSDWENNWRQYYKPIEIGEKLEIVPEWIDAPLNGRIPLRLDPGLIFGTGDHPTTKLCLEAIDKIDCDGKKILDIGCGSGILGIGALLLGAASCTGCDIDPKAPEVAMSNAQLNNIGSDRIKIFAGDILSDSGMRSSIGTDYDIVLANIVADVIIPMIPLVSTFMAKDAILIISGIIDNRTEDVRKTIQANGFNILNYNTLEEWNSFICSF